MDHTRLRLDVPELDAPDHLVEQWAALARSSTPSAAARAPRRRLATVGTLAAGALLASVGGAWATGTIEVPGLPSQRVLDPAPRPAPAVPVAPVEDDTNADDDATGSGPGAGNEARGSDRAQTRPDGRLEPLPPRKPGKGDAGAGDRSAPRDGTDRPTPDRGRPGPDRGRGDHEGHDHGKDHGKSHDKGHGGKDRHEDRGDRGRDHDHGPGRDKDRNKDHDKDHRGGRHDDRDRRGDRHDDRRGEKRGEKRGDHSSAETPRGHEQRGDRG